MEQHQAKVRGVVFLFILLWVLMAVTFGLYENSGLSPGEREINSRHDFNFSEPRVPNEVKIIEVNLPDFN